MTKCTECNGVGYFTNVAQYDCEGQLYNDNAIERCDECRAFESDKEAEKYHKENN